MSINKYFARISQFFVNHPLVTAVIEWTKTHSFPGLQKIPLYNIIKFINKELNEDAIVTRANSMAFSFFLALFPGFIVLVSLLPYFPFGDAFFEQIERAIKEVVRGKAGENIFAYVQGFLKTPRRDILSFGFFLAIWFSSNGMLSMMKGLEKNYATTFRRRNALEKRGIAIWLTILLSLVMMASVIFIVLGETILKFIFNLVEVGGLAKFAGYAFRWVAIVALFYTGISLIYQWGASTRRKIPFINSGAVLATVLNILTSWVFSFYINNFGNFNKVYGSIGTVIIMLLWIQLNCFILLIGFELNASIAVLRDLKREKDSDLAVSSE